MSSKEDLVQNLRLIDLTKSIREKYRNLLRYETRYRLGREKKYEPILDKMASMAHKKKNNADNDDEIEKKYRKLLDYKPATPATPATSSNADFEPHFFDASKDGGENEGDEDTRRSRKPSRFGPADLDSSKEMFFTNPSFSSENLRESRSLDRKVDKKTRPRRKRLNFGPTFDRPVTRSHSRVSLPASIGTSPASNSVDKVPSIVSSKASSASNINKTVPPPSTNDYEEQAEDHLDEAWNEEMSDSSQNSSERKRFFYRDIKEIEKKKESSKKKKKAKPKTKPKTKAGNRKNAKQKGTGLNLMSVSVKKKKNHPAFNKMKLIKTGKPRIHPQYLYWNDPSELVNRLYLLHCARRAGNNSVNNEILSIEEELRESGYIR